MKFINVLKYFCLLFSLVLFNQCRPDYYEDDIVPSITTTISDGVNITNVNGTATFPLNTPITIRIDAQGSSSNTIEVLTSDPYTFASSPNYIKSVPGFPILIQEKNISKTFIINSPSSSHYTIIINFITSGGQKTTQYFHINPNISSYSGISLYRNYSTLKNCFNFKSKISFSYSTPTLNEDIVLTESTTTSTTTFYGTLEAYAGNAYIVATSMSSSDYNKYKSYGSYTQANLRALYENGTKVSSINVYNGGIYVIRTSEYDAGRNYAIIKITNFYNLTGVNNDFINFEYLY